MSCAGRSSLRPCAGQLGALVGGMLKRLAAAAPSIALDVMGASEAGVRDTCLAEQPNRRMAGATRALQAARVVNRLFATHVVQHDERDLQSEHRLVLGHVRRGDAEGAAATLRYHLGADHDRALDRTRDRLKVLSDIAAPAVSPYLTQAI